MLESQGIETTERPLAIYDGPEVIGNKRFAVFGVDHGFIRDPFPHAEIADEQISQLYPRGIDALVVDALPVLPLAGGIPSPELEKWLRVNNFWGWSLKKAAKNNIPLVVADVVYTSPLFKQLI